MTTKSYGGRYAVQHRVGSGGMAEVYRARDELLGREVAVKVLSERFSKDHSFVERFRREAQSAANLNHPNIVSLYDYGADDGTYFIVMEFIEGRSLSEVIAQEGALLPERAAEITADVAEALDRAHASGLIHRDIKPGNIMLTAGGQTKVTDFGIARALDRGDQSVTQTGMVMGTAAYLSPEQAQGDPVDARSDVYSMGCVLYEMLTGEAPFTGDTPLAIAYKHVRETPRPPSAVNPDVPESLDAIVLKALAKNPDNRFQSAGEMRDDLRRFLHGQTVRATPVLSDATTVAAAGAGTRVLRATEDEGPEPNRRWWYALVALAILAVFGVLAWLLARNLLAPEMVEVPDVVGRNVDVAEQMLEDVGLEADVQRRTSRQRVDRVLDQDPAAGAIVEEGETVVLFVSGGPRQTTVPELIGSSRAKAEAALEDADLRVGEVTKEESDEEPGTVLAQDPDPGEEVDVGSRVDLVVSSGPAQVVVPFVEGQTEEQARSEIEAAGLQVEVRREPHDEEEGIVVAQDPEGGTQATRGDTVVIVVSEGPEEQEMPDVRGEDADKAEALLEDEYGLDVRQEDAAESCGEQPGRVCDQDPQPGESVQAGDEAILYVEPGPQAVLSPPPAALGGFFA